MFRLVFCAVLSALLCHPASAATFYVSPNGSDRASGSEEAPWKTISRSLSGLSAGDTLLVRGGKYTERVRKGILRAGNSGSRILVKAYPGERPVLEGLLWLTNPSFWTIDGLNVTWDTLTGAKNEHMVKFTGGEGWEFLNAEVWGARSYAAILVAQSTTGPASNWRIASCQIHDTYASNNTNQDHLIYCNTGLGGAGGVIERNVLWNAENGSGVKIGGADSFTGGSERVLVRFNTIYNTGQSILISGRSANNRIERNILVQTRGTYSSIRGYELSGEGNSAATNLCFLSGGVLRNDPGYVGIADGGGNLYPVNPLFDYCGLNGFHPLEPVAVRYGAYALLVEDDGMPPDEDLARV